MIPAVDLSQVGAVTLATISGDMELGTVSDLAAVLDELSASEGSVVVVDLTGVTFLDSSGLSLLVRLNRRLNDSAVRARVVCGPPTMRLMRLTGMDQVFSLYSTVSDAVRGKS